jgi:hypothetical protein
MFGEVVDRLLEPLVAGVLRGGDAHRLLAARQQEPPHERGAALDVILDSALLVDDQLEVGEVLEVALAVDEAEAGDGLLETRVRGLAEGGVARLRDPFPAVLARFGSGLGIGP